MRKPLFLLVVSILLCSHDLYVKMETYFLQPDQEASLSLYNGTFEKSENVIDRDRMLDASVVSHGEREFIHPEDWKDRSHNTVTQLPFNTGEAGTYVVGVSTKARNIELTADKFNDYLRHDGVLDMLEQRTKDGSLEQDAIESYQKHVKAIYQVGEERTDDWSAVLGYPIEFVPQANPYEKYSGEQLEVQLLLDGEPLPNQLVYANYIESIHAHAHEGHNHAHDDHDHGHDHDHAHADEGHNHGEDAAEEDEHTHTSGQQLRTNAEGVVSVNLPADGIYYLRTIHMTTVSDSTELTHQSKWATLTFEVSHSHDHSFLLWGLLAGGLVILGLVLLFFRRRK